jgi:hypothetical protein
LAKGVDLATVLVALHTAERSLAKVGLEPVQQPRRVAHYPRQERRIGLQLHVPPLLDLGIHRVATCVIKVLMQRSAAPRLLDDPFGVVSTIA